MIFPQKLKACWHPVGYSKEIGEKPYGTFLLDQAVVIGEEGMDNRMP